LKNNFCKIICPLASLFIFENPKNSITNWYGLSTEIYISYHSDASKSSFSEFEELWTKMGEELEQAGFQTP
jgi:hypothetical protein